MEKPNLNDQRMLTLLKTQHNDREVALYFLKKAKDAAGRVGTGIGASNYLMVTSNAQEMISNIEIVYKLLNVDGSLADSADN